MADPWNAAWEEAEATAPPGVMSYCTIELQHPAFDAPARAVTGVHADMSFGIEVGAIENGGETVVFQAVPFYAERPEFAEGKTPECEVTIDNAGRELMLKIEDAVQVKADLVVLYREYLSDDLSEPSYGPVQFVMRKVRVKGTTIVGTARLADLANRKFPFKVATIREFPALVGL